MDTKSQLNRSRSCLGTVLVLVAALYLGPTAGAVIHAEPAPRALEPGGPDKKPLSDKDLNSGAFRRLLETTGASILELTVLYQTSGAEDFEEFSQALMVSRILSLDHGLVLRALFSQDLEDILQELGVSEQRSTRALKIAKRELQEADKKWETRR